MKCPVCPDVTLVMADRSGIEIDYCPQCRGIWLDRGELDKIIERNTMESAGNVSQPAPHVLQQQQGYPDSRQSPDPRDYGFGHGDQHRRGHGSHHKSGRDGHYPNKKKSILGELFDF